MVAIQPTTGGLPIAFREFLPAERQLDIFLIAPTFVCLSRRIGRENHVIDT